MDNPNRVRISRQTKSTITGNDSGAVKAPLSSRRTTNQTPNHNSLSSSSPHDSSTKHSVDISSQSNTASGKSPVTVQKKESPGRPVKIHREAKVSILKDPKNSAETQLEGNASDKSNELGSSITVKRQPRIRQQQRRIRKNDSKNQTIESIPTAGQKLKDTVARSATSTAKEIALAPIKTHKIAAKKALEQGKQSTGLDNGANKSENAQAAEMIAAGFKRISNPENAVDAVRHIRKAPGQIKRNISGIRKSARGTKKAAQGLGQSAEGIASAIKNFKQAQYINSIVAQSKGKAAFNTTKNVSELAVRITKNILVGLANAIKTAVDGTNVVSFIGAFLVVIIVIVLAVGSIIFSAYGIFFTDKADNSMKIAEIVQNVNNDYQCKIKKITEDYDNITVSLVRYEGNKMQWKYILALYAVKYSTDGENILSVNKKTEERIKDIFYKVHSISADYVTEENPHAKSKDAPPDVNPYWTVLVVTTKAKPLSDVMDEMKFTKDQKSQVMNIVSDDTDDLWNEILYGHNGNGGPALAKIAKGQIGQTPQAYTSFTGVPNGREVEWSGSFVCWCANEAGYVTQGLYPQTNDKHALIEWFKDRGLWQNPDKQPNIGDTIFLSNKGSDECSLCGIVCKIENEKVYFISNDDDIVGTLSVSLKNLYNTIMGYGILPPMSGLRGYTVEEKIYNYLRKEGYSAVSACAVLANIQGDCGCDPEQFAKDHDYYTGILHWNGTEMTEFMDWCSDNAYDWRNLESQLIYYDHWVDELDSKGYWGMDSSRYHSNIETISSTNVFKSITASDYDGNTAKALYAATVIFTDDIARSNYLSRDESARYSYAVEFYNYLVSDSVDGSAMSAWNPDYAAEIGVFHLY